VVIDELRQRGEFELGFETRRRGITSLIQEREPDSWSSRSEATRSKCISKMGFNKNVSGRVFSGRV